MNDGQAWRIALRKTMSPGKAKKKKAARRSPTRPANKNPGASHKSLGAVKRCSSPDAQLFMPVSPWTPEPPGPPPCKPKMSLPVAGSPEAQTEAGLEKAPAGPEGPAHKSDDDPEPNMFYASGHSVLTAKTSASAVSCPHPTTSAALPPEPSQLISLPQKGAPPLFFLRRLTRRMSPARHVQWLVYAAGGDD